MKTSIIKTILITMVLISGLKGIWFLASHSMHVPGLLFIFGIVCAVMFISKSNLGRWL